MRTILLILILATASFARVTPLDPFTGPLATMQFQPAQSRGFVSSLDEHLNTRVNSDHSGEIQNEEQACINPLDPDNMVAVWRDFREGYRRIGVGYTLDGGATWHDTLFPQMYYEWQSDPVLVVDNDGIFTANMITFNPDGDEEVALLSVSSYDGGVTWQDSVIAVETTDLTAFEDKQMMAIDNSPDSPYQGTFYIPWARFFLDSDGNYDSTHIELVYKRPDSAYTAPIQISSRRTVQWANVATGPNGEVYVTWISYSRDGIMFSRSLDGGQTWTEEERVFQTEFASAEIEPNLLVFSYMVMAVDNSNGPFRGRIHALFTDADNSLSNTDVFYTYSDDQGDNWSTPVVIDDENESFDVDQFHPWITVDEQGRVWCAWYDRRNDPNGLLMDVYFTVSELGGITWRPNERITTVSCNPGAGSLDAGLIGEYIGWHASNDKAICVWTDTRQGDQDAFASVIDSLFIEDAVENPNILHPSSFILEAFPNPFNGTTTLSYTLTKSSPVELTVFNTLGQEVFTESLGQQSTGAHTQSIELTQPSGVYFAKLSSRDQSAIAKLLLMR
ncbi:MAG: T9SS type A sorting domain-containing protein [Calditrichaeota bacterium]|nr:T9SS type A sorting domain-containing protein [Calditrichota bacterium]MCB9369403.1 T9SS type A sorting domain-containing protein [Calditrichota bacterium]